MSIADHIRRQLPTAAITYLADSQYFPYGLLAEEALLERVATLIEKTLVRCPADLVVVACNTASTLVLPILRARLRVPVVGVVPAIKPAAALSNSKVIGLLATPGTLRREYTAELIDEYAPNCEVLSLASNELVDVVERVMAGEQVAADVYRDILQPFYQHRHFEQLDTLVLACTHFPLVRQELEAQLPQVLYWVDSGSAVAQRVASLLRTAPAHHASDSVSEYANTLLLTDLSRAGGFSEALVRRYGFTRTLQWDL